MLVRVFPYILSGSVQAIAIWPFVFVKNKKLKSNQVLMNHERIHIRQQLELLVIPFFIIYIVEWVIRLFMEGNAYRNISFEREAYTNQYKLSYLKLRKTFAFLKYFKRTKLVPKLCNLSGKAVTK